MPADLVVLTVVAALPVALTVWFGQLLTSGLWWDEQWRAYHIALSGLQMDLGGTYSPTAPAWLLIEKLAAAVLGPHEWALRIPSVVAWVLIGPVAYLLGRRVMSRPFAGLAAAALAVNPAMLYFGSELKPYALEALVTLLVLLGWVRGREAHGGARLAWYGAIAAVSLLSIPALFVVAPLLALDVERVLRHVGSCWRASARSLLSALMAGALVLVPLALFVLPQPAGADYGFFTFVPYQLGQAWHAVIGDLGTYLSGAWTTVSLIRSDTGLITLPPASCLLTDSASWGVAVLVLLGMWHLRRSTLGRGLTAALGGSLALELVASLAHRWPFGLIRVNLFQLPLVLILTVAGLAAAWNIATNSGRLRLEAAAVLAAGLVLVAALVTQEGFTTRSLHGDLPLSRWETYLKSAVIVARRLAGPGTLAVVLVDGLPTTCMTEPVGAPHGLAWNFYMDFYDFAGLPASDRVPLASTYFATTAPQSAAGLPRFFSEHPGASTVVEYRALGGPVCPLSGSFLGPVIRKSGFHPVWTRTYRHSGALTVWQAVDRSRVEHAGSGRTIPRVEMFSGSESCLSVDLLPDDVEVTGVSCRLVDHVQNDRAEIGDLICDIAAGPPSWR